MLTVMGNLVLNAVAVALLYNVAMKVLVPIVILRFILLVSKALLELPFNSIFLLQQAKSWMQIIQDKKVITAFIKFNQLETFYLFSRNASDNSIGRNIFGND